MTRAHWTELKDLWLVYNLNKNTAYSFFHNHKEAPYINYIGRGKIYVNLGYLKRRTDIIDHIQDELQRYVREHNNTLHLIELMIKQNPKWEGKRDSLSVFLSTSIWRLPIIDYNMFNRQWSQLAYEIYRTLKRIKELK